MDKYKANAWSAKNEIATMVAGKFTYTKVKHKTKQKALFCKRQSLLPYAQALIVAILQVPDGKDSG